MDPTSIDPLQKAHADRILDIYKFWVAALDTSERGLGKSRIAMTIASQLDLPVFLVCKKEGINQWRNHASNFKVDLIDAINYDSLRGIKGSELKHDYLEREDRGEKSFYKPKEEFLNLVNEGVLLVIDECHQARNSVRKTFSAVRELARAICNAWKKDPTNRSRILLASATPGVKAEELFSILSLLGIVEADELFDDSPYRAVKLTGFQQLRDWCSKYGPVDFKGRDNLLTAKTMPKTIYDSVQKLYTRAVGPVVVSSIQADLPFSQITVSAYLPLPKEQFIEFKRIQNQSASSGKNQRGLGKLNPQLQSLEVLRTYVAAPFIRSIKREFPTGKVIVYCHYTETQTRLLENLAESFNCAIVNGSTSTENRKQTYKMFQEATSELEIIISHIKVSGTSIDLDDQHGDFPRFSIIMPNLHFIDDYQARGRANRRSTKSQPRVYEMWIRDAPEHTLLNASHFKGEMLNQIAPERHDLREEGRRIAIYNSPDINDEVVEEKPGDENDRAAREPRANRPKLSEERDEGVPNAARSEKEKIVVRETRTSQRSRKGHDL